MPFYSEEFQRDVYYGRIALGGCCITDDDPMWKCVECLNERIKKRYRNSTPKQIWEARHHL